MNKVLVSTCLLGEPVRYNGSDAPCDKTIFAKWKNEDRLVRFCPELAVDFPIPRPPAETVGGDGKKVLNGQAKVMENTGNDVTAAFIEGAKRTLKFAKENNVKVAILTDGSPSCGNTFVYDGSFSGKTVPGRGVASELLEQNGIRVFSETNIDNALEYLESLD